MAVTKLPIDNPELHLRPGTVVINHRDGRRYRVLKFLGAGGFGTAYRVAELDRSGKTTSRYFCLKVTTDPDGWYREAYFGDLLRSVNGVIQVYGMFAWIPRRRTKNPIYCLVTELAEGGDLGSWLEGNSIPWKEHHARHQIINLLQTVGKLHQRGAVHRDITPGNIFVSSNRTLKLGDFGIAAHRFGERYVPADVFARWLAPPGIAQGEARTWRSADDVFQLGQLFAMLLRGSAESKLTTRDVKALKCSPETKAVIQRSIGMRRKRYEDAAKMLSGLKAQQSLPRMGAVQSLVGKRVVFTGALCIPRSEARILIRRAGGTVQRAVCHTTDILVAGKNSPHFKADNKGQKWLDWDLERERGHHIAVIGEARFRVIAGAKH